MSLLAMQWACLLLVIGAEDPVGGPSLKTTPDPIPAIKKTRHYVVQVKLVEVDEQGHLTVLGEPKLQTTGGNAGISIDHADGRRFEFTMKLTDRLGSGDDLNPARSVGATELDSVLKKLDQKIDLDIRQQPRKRVLQKISELTRISVAIDYESVPSIVAEMESLIDLKAEDESVSTVIDRLIGPMKLAHVVKQDVVLIAAAEKLRPASQDFVLKTYDVADLLNRSGTAQETPNFAPLIDRIKSTVMPASWELKESAATIRPFNSTLSVVVRQTPSGHAAIDLLLEKIRREKSMSLTK